MVFFVVFFFFFGGNFRVFYVVSHGDVTFLMFFYSYKFLSEDCFF